jgi:GT2 family glycosyltransferase
VTVTALLVSHDGARWLPAVLEGLSAQTVRPDRVLVVDTGSTDATVDLVVAALGPEVLLEAPARTSYPAAVALGLHELGARGEEPEWLWLLHDDSRPAPDALERLLEVSAAEPSVDILGVKLREWPSLRRLLEVGVTMSGSGRRETGLERGEYDQGQHDRAREVLAVSSAGMLVRRAVLEDLGGFDARLPMYGNDLDLGWRAARAGRRTMVVPQAVVFHVEAAHRGLRRTPVTGNHRRGERRAALYTLMVNCSAAALPFVAVRLLLGSILRAVGLLLVRAPREALDELAALTSTWARPDRVVRGRLARRRTSTVPARGVRHLLAPAWLPYRHGLDLVSDLATALTHQASDASTARRSTRAVEPGPVPAEAEELPADTGLVARLLSSRSALLLTGLVVLAAVAARGLFGSGVLSGGALLPAPASAGHWWTLYLESWHTGGVGSGVPAAPYLLPLALAATLLVGQAALVVDVLFLLSVPLAAWGAGRFLGTLEVRGWSRLWGAVAYGLLPVVTGAVAQGRLGTVAAAVLLPWVAHAAVFLSPRQERDRRRRAAWRTALLLAVLSAFVPMAWAVAVLVAVAAVLAGLVLDRRRWMPTRAWAPVAVAVGAVPVLLLPWSVQRLLVGGSGAWYAEAGLPARDLVTDLDVWHLLTGRAADVGAAPGWFGLGITLAAVAALARRSTRPVVVAAWGVVVAALAAAVLLDAEAAWAGFPVLLAQAAAIAAAAVAGEGIGSRLSGRSFGWRQPLGLVVVLAALVSPLAGLVWWVVSGVDGPLDRRAPHGIPTYMTDAALRDQDNGILLVRGDGDRLGYSLLRGEGMRIGDDTVAAPDAHRAELTEIVAGLATAPSADHVARLSRHGVEFVYLAPPADRDLVGNLDSVSGLSAASALRPGARAWQLDAEPSSDALPPAQPSARPWLLTAQALAVVAGAVLAAPTRRAAR